MVNVRCGKDSGQAAFDNCSQIADVRCVPLKPTILDTLYRWESGSRAWSRWRQLLTLVLLEMPGLVALMALHYTDGRSSITRNFLPRGVLNIHGGYAGLGLLFFDPYLESGVESSTRTATRVTVMAGTLGDLNQYRGSARR